MFQAKKTSENQNYRNLFHEIKIHSLLAKEPDCAKMMENEARRATTK